MGFVGVLLSVQEGVMHHRSGITTKEMEQTGKQCSMQARMNISCQNACPKAEGPRLELSVCDGGGNAQVEGVTMCNVLVPTGSEMLLQTMKALGVSISET